MKKLNGKGIGEEGEWLGLNSMLKCLLSKCKALGLVSATKKQNIKTTKIPLLIFNIRGLGSHCQIYLDYSDCNILQMIWQGLSNSQRGSSI